MGKAAVEVNSNGAVSEAQEAEVVTNLRKLNHRKVVTIIPVNGVKVILEAMNYTRKVSKVNCMNELILS